MSIIRTGHYFEFNRGTWQKEEETGKITRYGGSGLTYIGWLTEEQKLALDKLINDFIEANRPDGY